MAKLIEINGFKRSNGLHKVLFKTSYISAVMLDSEESCLKIGYYGNFIEFFYPRCKDAEMQYAEVKKAIEEEALNQK